MSDRLLRFLFTQNRIEIGSANLAIGIAPIVFIPGRIADHELFGQLENLCKPT